MPHHMPSSLTGFEPPPVTPPWPFWFCSVLTLVAGLALFLVANFSYPLFHVLAEFVSIILAVAVFTIGWNARQLLYSSLFLILACGFLATGLIDLLHTLTYRGMGLFAGIDSNLPTQFWLVARGLETLTILLAAQAVGAHTVVNPRICLTMFVTLGGVLVATVWPLGIFPDCFVEGQGLTDFKIFSEHLMATLLAVAAIMIWRRRDQLDPSLIELLLFALLFKIFSGLSLTLYTDVYGLSNFFGHLFKLLAAILIYAALVKGTLRNPYTTLFRELVLSHHELDEELLRRRESEAMLRRVNLEFSSLHRIAQALHSTLNLDELSHLVLSAATAADGGRFERAMLFTVNPRTGTLQGMLGIDREAARWALPLEQDALVWEQPLLVNAVRERQRNTEFNRLVVKQRLVLDAEDNALARAFLRQSMILVVRPEAEPPGGQALAKALGLGPYACAPLPGRNQGMGILLVDNPSSGERISPESQRFLELFASQAGAALDNAGLIQRLEQAHEDLRQVQEQLIQGEKLAVLGEMAAQVAHELKNPLVSIGGFAQRLSRLELSDAKANEYAAIVAREVRRMEEMLGNILAFSKKQLVCLDQCDFALVLKEALDLERDNLQRHGVTIGEDIREDLPGLVGDCQQLRQVVLNLLINARQAMPEGGTLTVRLRPCLLRGEDALQLEVEDTGGGIPSEMIRNIFNPFFSTRAKGTGLGLSISHRIVEQHHGQIEVINGVQGACFIVRLPLKPPRRAMH